MSELPKKDTSILKSIPFLWILLGDFIKYL